MEKGSKQACINLILKAKKGKKNEKRKDRETQKSRRKEKVVRFTPTFLFPARKREAVIQGRTRGIDHPTRRITREDKRDHGRTPNAFT